MPSIARVQTDNAQGVITGPGAPTVKADNKKVSVENDKVAGHGDSPHSAPTLTSNYSSTVKANKISEYLKGNDLVVGTKI